MPPIHSMEKMIRILPMPVLFFKAPLFFAFDQSMDKPALHEENDEHGRKNGHDGRGHDQVPLRELGSAGDGRGNSHDHDLHLIGIGHHEGP